MLKISSCRRDLFCYDGEGRSQVRMTQETLLVNSHVTSSPARNPGKAEVPKGCLGMVRVACMSLQGPNVYCMCNTSQLHII